MIDLTVNGVVEIILMFGTMDLQLKNLISVSPGNYILTITDAFGC